MWTMSHGSDEISFFALHFYLMTLNWLVKLQNSKSNVGKDNGLKSIDDAATCRTLFSFPSKKYGTQRKYLGQGISSKVYLFQAESSKHTVSKYYAVKSFTKKDTKDEDEVKSIQKEVAIHRIVNDNYHVVHLLDSFKIKKFSPTCDFYLVLEYLPCTLQTLYVKHAAKVTLNDRLCYFKQIINGLIYLKSKNISHRDLKLENCGIDVHGNLKLLDFGSSIIGNVGYGMAGSPDYCSPEIYGNLKYNSFISDIWSVGIILVNLFYLSNQKWSNAKYDDAFYMVYKENSTIENTVSDLHAYTSAEFEDKKCLAGDLVLRLLKINTFERITLEDLLEDEWFTTIECCRDTPAHHDHMSLINKILETNKTS